VKGEKNDRGSPCDTCLNWVPMKKREGMKCRFGSVRHIGSCKRYRFKRPSVKDYFRKFIEKKKEKWQDIVGDIESRRM
jgi:hypothetical protein